MSSILADLFRQNVWANLRLIDACGEAGEESLGATVVGTFGDVYATLVHIVTAEEGYLAHLGGGAAAVPRDGDPLPDLVDLRERARCSGEGLVAIAEKVRGSEIVRGIWQGQPYEIPISIFFVQALNHGAEHRSQICTILTQQGVVPPELDGWSYLAEQSDEA